MGEGGRGEGNAGKDFGKSSVTFEDGRYSVSLPLKEQHELLPDNYDLSLARLNTLVKRLRKDQPILQEYNGIIEEQLHQGIVERIQ
jgi:hypothetical protein